MKPYKTIIAAALAAAVSGAMVSCDDDFDRPPVITPVATYEVNTPIAEFKEMFWNYTQSNSYTTIPVNAEGDSIIVGGRITTSDLEGNVYQTLVVQDETGALYFGVNMYDINEKYQYGQEVRINVTGMIVGGYNGLLQVGGIYNGSLGRMEEATFTTHAQVNGLPDKAKAQALIADATMAELKTANSTAAGVQEWQSRFVRFSGVHFNGGGTLKWTDNPGNTGYSNRTLIDAEGNELTFRTSNKSTFAGETLPAGTGNVVAMLSYYSGNWQLVMMDPATDCTDFDGTPSQPDGPSGDDIYAASFKDGMENYVIENVKAPAEVPDIWKHDSKYGYVIATAYANNSNYESESWLISPVIDLGGQDKAYLSYEQALNYFSSVTVAQTQAQAAIREEGSTTWTMLTPSAWPTTMNWDFSSVGDIDISAFAGKKVQLGFRYSSTASKAGTWELKNVVIRPTGNPSPVNPDTPDTPTVGAKFSKVTSITSGKQYVIVTDGKMATPLSTNYGYLQVVDVAVSGDIVEADEKNAFTIETADGGYTIKDASGKYYYMTGSFNSFNTDASAVAGSVFTITTGADGTMTITNVAMGKTLQYDSKYSSYGAYADITHPLPVLYEKVN
ncbi:MAG: DUF5689 domain-containing protein [Muribaculaceae bacterium]|nr:DUF5689 domain-containing protein [Muribaculaceae bacterium]